MIFEGYTGSKNSVQNRLKIQFIELDFSKLIFQKSNTDQQGVRDKHCRRVSKWQTFSISNHKKITFTHGYFFVIILQGITFGQIQNRANFRASQNTIPLEKD